MNKNECKKYLKRAFHSLKKQKKSINPINLEKEMKNKINKDSELYIAYCKMALYTLLKSATDVTLSELEKELDIMPEIYSTNEVLIKAKKLT